MKNIPAFPRPIGWNGDKTDSGWASSSSQEGMTLRDYFAAKALPACIQSEEHAAMIGDKEDFDPLEAALNAYAYADAMLKAREAK